jgi:phosphate transport system substrate-binding protein
MSLRLLLAGLIFFSYPLYAMDIHGAGATFPALLYQKWAESYTLHKGIEVQYLAVGSGEGIKRIDEKVVDFGGSDMPLTADELSKKGLFQFPMVMGAITPVFNIPGVYIAQLKLDANTLANIFLGKIKKWNDPVLLALNPSMHMPDLPIIVIHREDKSGTTFNFTNYLSKISEDWRQKVGEGLAVNWPTGESAKGNSGVANKVKETSGAIGYVDYADAMEKHLNYPLLKNHDGFFVRPNAGSTEAAAAGAKWDAENGFYQVLTNAPGETSWPIAATTFILVRKDSNDVEYTQNVLKFINWNFRTGELPAMYFDFVMPPKQVVEMIRTSWRAVKDHAGKSVWN